MELNTRATSQQWMRKHAEKDLGDFPNHEVVLHEGDILETMLEVEKEKHIGTIVMRPHRPTGIAHILLGKSRKVIRSVYCPVYVIRHPGCVTERGAAESRSPQS